MRIVLLFLVLLLAPAFADAQAAQSVVCRTDMPLQTAEWVQYEDPAAAGWSAAALEDARAHATAIGSTAVMVLYRGRVLLAWGDIDVRHNIHSIRKSLLGALVGIAVEEGNIRPSATLAELGIDDSPPLTAQERTARVVHLLQARSGVYHPAAYETADMEQFRPERDSHAPGTHWFYNNWDFNTLATIYRNATGEDLFEAFERRMARPLGMQDFRLEDTRYVHDKSKSVHPAYLFSLSARDLARFGQLWLRDGCWNGRAVVPSAWVRASVTSYSKAFDGGYGYASWWTYPAWFGAEYGYDRLRSHDSWMTTGTGGQLIWVVPDLDLVFVHLHERSA
ncbi:MAG TPA: serine hydrolase, partial [Longimicrobiales bacterium]|nr:serine hydrolase [Longimicrobiales bacterium]